MVPPQFRQNIIKLAVCPLADWAHLLIGGVCLTNRKLLACCLSGADKMNGISDIRPGLVYPYY